MRKLRVGIIVKEDGVIIGNSCEKEVRKKRKYPPGVCNRLSCNLKTTEIKVQLI